MLIKYIILGFIQGITEPLPISSSGHIIIFKKIFNIKMNDINFEIIVNFASFIAVLFLYRKKIIKLIDSFIKYIIKKDNNKKEDFNYTMLLVIATLPTCILGLLFKNTIDKIGNNTKLIGFALLITSFALYIIKDFKGKKNNITISDAIKIGIYQVIALFPGISRSGATIFGGLKLNLTRKEAVDFSFMLYLPVSFGAIILGLFDLIKTQNISSLIPFYIISFIVSMITTYFSIKWFIKIVKKGKLIYFSIYCFIIGILTIIFI